MGERDTDWPPPDMEVLVAALAGLQRDYLRAAGSMCEQLMGALGGREQSPGGTDAVGQDAAGPAQRSRAALKMSAHMLRAYSEWMQGGLRYLSRAADINGSHAGELCRRLGQLEADGLDEKARRELNDEVRAYLRRLGDLSVQEACLVKQRLALLETELREPPDDDAPTPPVRRVRAKD